MKKAIGAVALVALVFLRDRARRGSEGLVQGVLDVEGANGGAQAERCAGRRHRELHRHAPWSSRTTRRG